jgi:hypothetical protein
MTSSEGERCIEQKNLSAPPPPFFLDGPVRSLVDISTEFPPLQRNIYYNKKLRLIESEQNRTYKEITDVNM